MFIKRKNYEAMRNQRDQLMKDLIDVRKEKEEMANYMQCIVNISKGISDEFGIYENFDQ